MWMVFLFILGIIGVFLVNTFGNITTTNQQDYTLIKNITEAAMNDAIDWASYSAGFYLCTNKTKTTVGSTTKYVFDSKDDYTIIRNVYGSDMNNLKSGSCKKLVGETIINKDVFVESFLRRFAETVYNNKSYRVTIQDVIEYPPKASVRIETFNTYNSTQAETKDFFEGDFTIQNQVDAIIEEKNNKVNIEIDEDMVIDDSNDILELD